MITLCMIVKNEESNLQKCLVKAKDYVQEIVIVDTGSTDRTKDVALQYTDKIYEFQWNDDFSVARNFAITKASNDWILVLDADEFVTVFFRDNVQEFINNFLNNKKVGRIEIINIMDDSTGNKKYMERVNRLFNRNYFHYEGIIHEQLVAFDGKTYETENIDITADHVGYTHEVLNRTHKLKRNIDLLEEALKNDSEDPYIYFQLGKSYYMLKDYKTSALYFEKALTFEVDFRLEYVEDLVETYGYSLINSGRYSEALILENCLEVYSKLPDFHFIMGLIYMNNAKFTQAVESFLECTKFPYAKVEGITTYSAYYNIGVIYEVLGFRENAIEYYKMCGDYEPVRSRFKEYLN